LTIIRPVDAGEIAALSELARTTYSDAFGHTFSPSDLAFHLKTNLSDAYFRRAIDEDTFLVASTENRLVGFVQFGAVKMPTASQSSKDQELRRLYVASDFQNRGIGTRLMQSALGHPRLGEAANIFLDVWEQNHGAQKLYQRYGFEVIGARALAVASGVAADRDLIMVRRSRSL
jgi:diamine N-acetyltransferase